MVQGERSITGKKEEGFSDNKDIVKALEVIKSFDKNVDRQNDKTNKKQK